MGKLAAIVSALSDKLSVSRRSFIKSAMAVGALTTVYGCSKNDGEGEIIYTGGGIPLKHPKI